MNKFRIFYILILVLSCSSNVWAQEEFVSDNVEIENALVEYDDNGDLKDGKYELYYDETTLEEVVNYQEGLLHGKQLRYYDDGTLWIEENYKDGLEHGLFKEYDEEGRIIMIESYAEGLLEGSSKIYFENGEVEEDLIYQKGNLKETKRYDNLGKLIEHINHTEEHENDHGNHVPSAEE